MANYEMRDMILVMSVLFVFSNQACNKSTVSDPVPVQQPVEPVGSPADQDYSLAQIDLNNWKVTLPIGDPSEVEPPEILNYALMPELQEFMYNDSSEGAIVFRTFPGSTTANSRYSRTELREQIDPGNDGVNWTFEQGGHMRGTLRVSDVSRDEGGDTHRVIIMQIHGRLTVEQRERIGAKDYNAPPILKVYWENGRVQVKTKVLKKRKTDETEILYTDAWEDDEGQWFDAPVDNDKFTLDILASAGSLKVSLNDEQTFVYEGNSMDRWGIFENYFKAGNYLNTTDPGSYSEVKYYELEVRH